MPAHEVVDTATVPRAETKCERGLETSGNQNRNIRVQLRAVDEEH
jgi:hypothetical protein